MTDVVKEASEEDLCSHCLSVVPEDLGVENSLGDVLCGACYFVLWGPKAISRSSRVTKTTRPRSRRAHHGAPIWMPGPTSL